MKARIAPSILSADFGRLAEEIAMCEAGGADLIHVDVMDGRFVPNLTFGEKAIAVARKTTKLPIDVHLMVVDPSNYFDSFADAGANGLTFHAEAESHIQRQLTHIRGLGCRAGVALNPATSLAAVDEILDDLDLLLIMTVNPGFGGQTFIPQSLEKVERARTLLDAAGSAAALEVDGGVDRDTIGSLWKAGADTFVAGNAIFSAKTPKAEIGELRKRCVDSA